MRASSREPLFASLKRFPPKKSKNGHNALIWHLLHAGYFIYANLSNRANQRESDCNNFNLAFPNSLHKRSRAVNRFVKNGKANFGSPIEGNSKYSGQKKPKWIFHLTSTKTDFRDLWHNENTSGLHMLVHWSRCLTL